MKVIVTVIDDRDVDKVMGALTDQHIGVTRISSTGDFIAPGNSTLLIGVDEQIVPRVMQMIVDYASPRQSFVPVAYDGTVPLAGVIEAQVGGFLSFVLDVEHFEQVRIMSKLILAIIFNSDAVDPLAQALLAQDYSLTKISSMGGFLRRQNTTFVIGVEEDRLPGAMTVIREVCSPYSRPEGHAATIFVLDVAEFVRN